MTYRGKVARPGVQTESYSAEQIQEMIKKAGFKMNTYAKAYFDTIKDTEDAENRHGETPEKRMKTQVLCFFANCEAQTSEQKQVKKDLLAWANYPDYRLFPAGINTGMGYAQSTSRAEERIRRRG